MRPRVSVFAPTAPHEASSVRPRAVAPPVAIATLIATLVIALLTSASARSSTHAAPPPGASDQVLNVGHRGASGYAPEHTIPAYDLALRLGADYIEQDLQLTADGVLVVLHDETLDRTARGPAENCAGPVSAKTLAQIKTCDVGSWFNERFPDYARPEYVGLRVPTLKEVFERYRHSANYYIETKSPETADRMEERLLELMDAYGLTAPAEDRGAVLIQSFSPLSLQRISALNPRLPLIQLYAGSETSATIRATLDVVERYAVGIGPSKTDVDADLVREAHTRCLDIHPFTVNEQPEMTALIEAGVDGMFTNFPDRLDAVLGIDAVPGRHAAFRAAQASERCRDTSALASGTSVDDARRVSVRLLGINDLHGHLEPPPFIKVGGRAVGGVAYLGSYLNQAQAQNPNGTIRVHAGDAVGGSPLISSYFHDEPAIYALNAMRFDVGTVGNHEFDEGGEEMLRLIGGGRRDDGKQFKDGVDTSDPNYPGADFPYLAANTEYADGGGEVLPPYTIVRRKGMRIGFIGVTTEETPNIVSADMVAPFRFTDVSDAVNRYTAELRRKGVETIVVLAHSGAFQSGDTAVGEIVGETAEMSDAVDVVVAGHTHSRLNLRVGRKLVVEAFSYGTAFESVDLEIDRATRDVVDARAEIVTTFNDSVVPDPRLAALVDAYRARIAPVSDRVIGDAATAIRRTATPAGESPLGDLIADAQRTFADADLAFMNPGGIRADIEAGETTYGELFAVQPFDNQLVRMELTGDQIRALLEQQFQPDRTRILQVSGLTYSYDSTRPAGARVGAIALDGGAPIDPAAVYTVAVNSFIATGGDGFSVLTEGVAKTTVGGDLEALVDYIQGLAQPFSAPADTGARIVKEG